MQFAAKAAPTTQFQVSNIRDQTGAGLIPFTLQQAIFK